MIKWAREVAMAQGFFLVVKRSDIVGCKAKALISECELLDTIS